LQILQTLTPFLRIRSWLACVAYERILRSSESLHFWSFGQLFASHIWPRGLGDGFWSCPSNHPSVFLWLASILSILFHFHFIALTTTQYTFHRGSGDTGEGVRGQDMYVGGGWTFCLCRFVGILTSHSRIIIIRVCFIWPTAAFVRVSWSSSTDFPLFTQKKKIDSEEENERKGLLYFVIINILNKNHKVITEVV